MEGNLFKDIWQSLNLFTDKDIEQVKMHRTDVI